MNTKQLKKFKGFYGLRQGDCNIKKILPGTFEYSFTNTWGVTRTYQTIIKGRKMTCECPPSQSGIICTHMRKSLDLIKKEEIRNFCGSITKTSFIYISFLLPKLYEFL